MEKKNFNVTGVALVTPVLVSVEYEQEGVIPLGSPSGKIQKKIMANFNHSTNEVFIDSGYDINEEQKSVIVKFVVEKFKIKDEYYKPDLVIASDVVDFKAIEARLDEVVKGKVADEIRKF